MSGDRWAKVEDLFHQALDMPREERRQWLEAACAGDAEVQAEVLSLLGSDAVAAQGFLENQLQPAIESFLSKEPEAVPTRAGPYRLVSELGRGGMGTVYLAERDDEEYQARVAVKLVRRGMDTDMILSRFYRERQTLARLQHPNIARLLDGGTTGEGHPYIVMEFVEGERITDYCRERSLSIPRIVSLFLNVCKAVSYAHRHFVVHRDIKPGNILVDQSGDVKLLDFGICKLLQTKSEADETRELGPVALTPEYASPEQVQGDPITVASDVYSLAAVLYELLTGVKAHRVEDFSVRGLERAICETEIVRPSIAASHKAIARQLHGDLDNILMTALQKDPQRRYETADRFAEDLRRYLDHEPVSARPDRVAYRVGKFLRRRQGLVAALCAVLVTMAAGVFFSVREARRARENLRMVRQLSNTFLFEVHGAMRNLPGATKARELIVQTGLKYLENLSGSAAGDLEFQFELAGAHIRLADVQGNVLNANLGDTKGALTSYGKALVLLDTILRESPDHRRAIGEKIVVYRQIGNIYEYQRETAKARENFLQAKNVAEELLQRAPDEWGISVALADVHVASSNALRREAKWADARKGYHDAVELLEKLLPTHSDDSHLLATLAAAYGGGGMCDIRLGRMDEAIPAYRREVNLFEKLLAQDPLNALTQRNLMIAYSSLGDILGNPNLTNKGDRQGAMEAYRPMLEIGRKLHEADPADQRARSDYAIALSRMAVVLPDQEVQSRIQMLSKAVDLQREVARVSPANLANRTELAATYRFLGDAYVLAKQDGSATAAYREGLRWAEEIMQNASPLLATAAVRMYENLGKLEAGRGNRRATMDFLRRIAEITDTSRLPAKNMPPNSQGALLARAAASRGRVFAALARSASHAAGDLSDARRWLNDSLRQYREIGKRPSTSIVHLSEVQALQKELEALP